jgi:predicted NodU family carbamoyl transferase
MSAQYILGVSAYYHDSAAALLNDGEIVAAASEERFTRKKGDATFPHRAAMRCVGFAVDMRASGHWQRNSGPNQPGRQGSSAVPA